MGASDETSIIECPRCGRLACEQNGHELLCPHCLLHESLGSFARSEGNPSVSPSDAMALEFEDQFLPENLGEQIEQVPADYENWGLSLNQERILKMNVIKNDKQNEKSVTVFDVMIAEEGKNGKTYWHNLGVAFPLTNGSNGLSLKLHMFPGLRIFVKESIRPVGLAKTNRDETPAEDAPF